jgi:hypothetical protein
MNIPEEKHHNNTTAPMNQHILTSIHIKWRGVVPTYKSSYMPIREMLRSRMRGRLYCWTHKCMHAQQGQGIRGEQRALQVLHTQTESPSFYPSNIHIHTQAVESHAMYHTTRCPHSIRMSSTTPAHHTPCRFEIHPRRSSRRVD